MFLETKPSCEEITSPFDNVEFWSRRHQPVQLKDEF